jgi:hypothetical protein
MGMRRPLSTFKNKTFTIIEALSAEGYVIWNISVRIGNSLDTIMLRAVGIPKTGIAAGLKSKSNFAHRWSHQQISEPSRTRSHINEGHRMGFPWR